MIMAIQDPPARRSMLLSFPGFLSFVPSPPGRPHVAIYISRQLDLYLSCTTISHDILEMLSVDVFSPEDLCSSPDCSLRVTSV